MLALPMSYFATRRTGDIQRRLEGVREVREFIVQNGMAARWPSFNSAALAIMAVYSLTLLAVFLAVAPLYALLMRLATKVLRPLFAQLEEATAGTSRIRSTRSRGSRRSRRWAEKTFRGACSTSSRGGRQAFRADFTSWRTRGPSRL